MKRIILSITLFLCMIVYAGVAFCSPSIEGKWERFGDGSAGSIVQVEKLGDKWFGTLLKPMGDLEIYRFKTGEIVWKDLQKVANQKYRGTVLRKRLDSYHFRVCKIVCASVLSHKESSKMGKRGRGSKWQIKTVSDSSARNSFGA